MIRQFKILFSLNRFFPYAVGAVWLSGLCHLPSSLFHEGLYQCCFAGTSSTNHGHMYRMIRKMTNKKNKKKYQPENDNNSDKMNKKHQKMHKHVKTIFIFLFISCRSNAIIFLDMFFWCLYLMIIFLARSGKSLNFSDLVITPNADQCWWWFQNGLNKDDKWGSAVLYLLFSSWYGNIPIILCLLSSGRFFNIGLKHRTANTSHLCGPDQYLSKQHEK